MIIFGSIPFLLAALIFFALASGRVSASGCFLAGIWLCAAGVLALLTLVAFAEKSAGKSFADADLQFIAVCWVVLLLPWFLRRRRP